MGNWIEVPDRKNTYRCSICGGIIQTAYPIEYWTRCPFCHNGMIATEGEATDGNSEAEKDS